MEYKTMSSSPLVLPLPCRTISSFVVASLLLLAISPSSAQENVAVVVGDGSNWDILYRSAITDPNSKKILLDYRIGSGRMYDIELFERDCVIPVDDAMHFVVSRTYEDDGMASSSVEEEERRNMHDVLEISLDLGVGSTTASTSSSPRNDVVWVEGERLQFCVRVRLLSVGSMSGAMEVIKEE
jgi:hypothetical protein